jgi:ribosomal-protein-alanine N-acetyltransferase
VLSVDAVTSDPAHRGRGIGRMLMNDMVHWARQQGLAGVELEVREGNVAAVGLYRSMGFAAIGRLEDFYDTGVHALQMRLMFETGC